MIVRWKDGSTTWVPMKEMKESYPVQVSENAVLTRIQEEPAFAWWFPHVLQKRNRIIAKLKSKYWVCTHKFGLKVPKSVTEAISIDRENGDTLCWDAIFKEMKNVCIDFQELEGDKEDIPPGYQFVNCNMIFDINMGKGFRRKARMVFGGHITEAPASLTYSSVVSRNSVRITLTIAALNGLKVLGCNIQNSFFTAKCRDKCYTQAGTKFGSDRGKLMLITRALYGLKTSSASFRYYLAETLYELGYTPTKSDPDVWLQKADGFQYYDMFYVMSVIYFVFQTTQ